MEMTSQLLQHVTLLLVLVVYPASTQETPDVPDFSSWVLASAPGPDLRLTFSASLPNYPLIPGVIDASTAEHRTLSLILKLWVLPDSLSVDEKIKMLYRYLPLQPGTGIRFYIDVGFVDDPTEREVYLYIRELGLALTKANLTIPTPNRQRSNITDPRYHVTQPFSTSSLGGPYDRDDPCSVYTSLEYCGGHSECVAPTANHLPRCQCLPNYGGDACDQQTINPLAAAGLAGAGLLVFAGLIGAIFCVSRLICRRREPPKRHKQRREPRSESRHNPRHELRRQPQRESRPPQGNTHRFFEPMSLPRHNNQWHRRSDTDSIPTHANHWEGRSLSSLYNRPGDDDDDESSRHGVRHDQSIRHGVRTSQPYSLPFPAGTFMFYPAKDNATGGSIATTENDDISSFSERLFYYRSTPSADGT